jgi:hypothetical protein
MPSTVLLEVLSEHRVILLTGRYHAEVEDVDAAFAGLLNLLEEADSPFSVAINVLTSPRLPFLLSTQDVLKAPARHPNTGEWLVVGTEQMGRVVQRLLNRASDRANVHLFCSEQALWQYLEQVSGKAARASNHAGRGRH